MNLNPNSTCWAGPNRSAAHSACASDASAAQNGVAQAGSRLRSAADERGPTVRETDRGGEGDGGATRRRWLLRRGQRCYDVHLARAHLAVSSIDAIVAATGVGDEHGGARPWHGRLRRDYGTMARKGDPTSISGMHWT